MVMPLQLPEPPNQVTDLISGKLQYVGEQAGTGPSALGGSAPAELTLTDPHEVYTLALNELVGRDDPLPAARPVGWRYMLSNEGQVVTSAMTTLNQDGEHRFALFNNGPYVGGTVAALAEAAELPEAADQDMEVRLLTVPALHLTAVWLHGDQDDVLMPLTPAPPSVTPGQPYPAGELLATLREPARALAEIGPDDETGG
jgi:hypothetical protein